MPALLGGRRPQLDGIRALAVLLVFGAHATSHLPGGFVGVDVFFALSGVLITSLLADEFGASATIDRPAFYMRRFLRLYPALVLTLVVAAVLTPILGLAWRWFAVDVGTSLTYTFNFWTLAGHPSLVGHFWSLSVEEQYYLLWPPLLLVLLRRGIAVKGTAIAAGVLFAVQVALVPVLGGGRLYVLPFGHADELLIGSLLGLLLSTRSVPALRRVLAYPAVPWLAGAVLAVVALKVGNLTAPWLYCGGLALLAALAGAAICHVLLVSEGPAARLLATVPLVWLGKRSYAFYLLHGPVLAVMRHEGASETVGAAVGLVVTLAASALSWWLVETPFLRRKRRWERSREQLAAADDVASDGAAVRLRLRTRWHTRKAWCPACGQPAERDGFCSDRCAANWLDTTSV